MLLHPIRRRASVIGRAGLQNHHPQERANKVFGKLYSRLLLCFFKFFITTRLPLRRTHTEGRRLQCELRQTERRLRPIIVLLSNHVLHIEYVDMCRHDFPR
jgi:hypothetical protein